MLVVLGGLPYLVFVVFMILGVKRGSSGTRSTDLPDVAVIVAARNEASNLPGLLLDLQNQDYKGEYQIIIADDRSLDDTWSIIHKASKADPRIKAVRIVEPSPQLTGKKNALTQCIKHTKASILLETDADCRMGPGWVSAMVSQFDEQTGVVVGYSHVRGDSIFARYQALDFLGIMMTNAGMVEHGKAWSGSGQNLAFRRKYFTDIGGFTADPGQSIGDDFYLVQKIGKLPGVRTRFCWEQEGFVTTAASSTIKEFYEQRKRWASDSRGLYRKDPLFFAFLLSAFLLNLALLLHALTGGWTFQLTLVLLAKFGLEFSILSSGVHLSGRQHLLWLFPLYFVLQLAYIPFMGVAGQLGKVRWK